MSSVGLVWWLHESWAQAPSTKFKEYYIILCETFEHPEILASTGGPETLPLTSTVFPSMSRHMAKFIN
jgi:hypothetical protein